MNNYKLLLVVQAIINFTVIIIFGSILVTTPASNSKGKIKIHKSLYKTFSTKMIVYIVLAALGLTQLLTYYTTGLLTKAIIFITILCIAPYFIKNNMDRIKKEDMFNDVVVYCSNMGMLLRQTKKVYPSLSTVKNDVGLELSKDIEVLQESFNVDKKNSKEVMEAFETKYPYTCISNLDIIMYHMMYESPKMSDQLFDTYLNDIAKLEQDMKSNKIKRTTMRITYFGLTIGGFLMYLYFYSSLSATVISTMYQTTTFKVYNFVYIYSLIFSLLFVDRYFCANTFKEA